VTPAPVEIHDIRETTSCVVGAGPGGGVARRGVDVMLLEAHQDFDREFRGDTLYPVILEILDEIGLTERLHELPHVKVYGPVVPTARGPIRPFDLRRLEFPADHGSQRSATG
jgi:2-polyprenyl-6-methoxyphenol hydroxylase-like FAD-dependent oxidoreductase